jgi:hypothetical protein
LPDQWKESVTVPVCKKGDKTDCSDNRGISVQKVIQCPSVKVKNRRRRIMGNYQCGFRRNRSPTNQMFYIRQIRGNKWDYSETKHQLL